MNLDDSISIQLKQLDLMPLADEQVECLRDSSRVEEAAGMLEDLRDRCGVRLPLPQGEVVGGPYATSDDACAQALKFVGQFAVVAVDAMATDESRSGEGENEYYVTGYNGAQAVLALAERPQWVAWWVQGNASGGEDLD